MKSIDFEGGKSVEIQMKLPLEMLKVLSEIESIKDEELFNDEVIIMQVLCKIISTYQSYSIQFIKNVLEVFELLISGLSEIFLTKILPGILTSINVFEKSNRIEFLKKSIEIISKSIVKCSKYIDWNQNTIRRIGNVIHKWFKLEKVYSKEVEEVIGMNAKDIIEHIQYLSKQNEYILLIRIIACSNEIDSNIQIKENEILEYIFNILELNASNSYNSLCLNQINKHQQIHELIQIQKYDQFNQYDNCIDQVILYLLHLLQNWINISDIAFSFVLRNIEFLSSCIVIWYPILLNEMKLGIKDFITNEMNWLNWNEIHLERIFNCLLKFIQNNQFFICSLNRIEYVKHLKEDDINTEDIDDYLNENVKEEDKKEDKNDIKNEVKNDVNIKEYNKIIINKSINVIHDILLNTRNINQFNEILHYIINLNINQLRHFNLYIIFKLLIFILLNIDYISLFNIANTNTTTNTNGNIILNKTNIFHTIIKILEIYERIKKEKNCKEMFKLISQNIQGIIPELLDYILSFNYINEITYFTSIQLLLKYLQELPINTSQQLLQRLLQLIKLNYYNYELTVNLLNCIHNILLHSNINLLFVLDENQHPQEAPLIIDPLKRNLINLIQPTSSNQTSSLEDPPPFKTNLQILIDCILPLLTHDELSLQFTSIRILNDIIPILYASPMIIKITQLLSYSLNTKDITILKEIIKCISKLFYSFGFMLNDVFEKHLLTKFKNILTSYFHLKSSPYNQLLSLKESILESFVSILSHTQLKQTISLDLSYFFITLICSKSFMLLPNDEYKHLTNLMFNVIKSFDYCNKDALRSSLLPFILTGNESKTERYKRIYLLSDFDYQTNPLLQTLTLEYFQEQKK
ncbi:hypothetical protein QTN25_002200 [Entamoeba marina]